MPDDPGTDHIGVYVNHTHCEGIPAFLGYLHDNDGDPLRISEETPVYGTGERCARYNGHWPSLVYQQQGQPTTKFKRSEEPTQTFV